VDSGAKSDEELLKAVAGSDVAAMSVLIDRYKDRVSSFMAWHFSIAKEEAEDMAQEVFLAVYKSAASFKGDSLFRTWLFSLARNVGLRYVRNFISKKLESAGLMFGEEEFENIPEPASGLLDRLESAERDALVRRAVGSLPDKLKTVVMLREWEEMSYEEIAAVLDIPLGTVRSRLHNAHSSLVTYLGDKL
jgi:RNA polymerase sigma-70 factor (ECF subfamily)